MSASLAKIMVVEDESIVAKDLELTLKRLGYIVPATASSSDDALSKAAQYRPDLVLLDVHIKGATDGIATARRLRQEMNIPVIYLTVYADDDTVARAKETEPFGYLRMREIVADLGRFARPEASPARSAVDLWESLETAIRLSSHQIKHHALIVR